MKKTKLIPSLLALAAAIALLAGLYHFTLPTPVPGTKSVTVSVIHSDQTTKTFRFVTDKEYLGDLLLTEDLVSGEQGAYGLYIIEVDGETAIFEENGAYWALFEGDSYAAQGADTTVMEDGDVFSLVYTRG